MKIGDALSQLRGLADQGHKYWAYFQLFTSAMVLFAWNQAKDQPRTVLAAVLVYGAFAALNCRLVFIGQRATSTAWAAIQKFSEKPDSEIDPTLMPLIREYKPDDPTFVLTLHLLSIVAAIIAMLASLGWPWKL